MSLKEAPEVSLWAVQTITEEVVGYFKVQNSYNEPGAVLAQCIITHLKPK